VRAKLGLLESAARLGLTWRSGRARELPKRIGSGRRRRRHHEGIAAVAWPAIVDGSRGEGGGQVLRSSLALCLVTGSVLRIERIRAGRKRPGLMRQHLTAVRAAAAVGCAEVHGDRLGSTSLELRPQRIRAGDYHFAVGTAGSATLVLQTVLPALLRAASPSTLSLEGGTHNPAAPTFDFLEHSFAPALRRIGARVELELERPGFYPAGGGRMKVRVFPQTEHRPLELLEPGPIQQRQTVATVAAVPRHVAERELKVVSDELGFTRAELRCQVLPPDVGPGNVLSVRIGLPSLCVMFVGFGEKRRRAEQVAMQVVSNVKQWLECRVPVEEHLADQLLLPIALSAGGRFRTTRPSLHTRTHLELLSDLLQTDTRCEDLGAGRWEITVRGQRQSGH
jgi:RNA 3'-terminal phosphate cyclase (ATP)